MQVEFKGDALKRMESLAIQEQALLNQLQAAIENGDHRAIKKTKFDLKQTEKGNNRILDLFA